MSELAAGGKWYAMFCRTQPGDRFVGYSYAPVAAWENRCVDGLNYTVGLVTVDRDGNNLPFLVAAADVPGFLRYQKRGEENGD